MGGILIPAREKMVSPIDVREHCARRLEKVAAKAKLSVVLGDGGLADKVVKLL